MKNRPQLLACAIAASLLPACSSFDADSAVADLAPGSQAIIGEMKSGFYAKRPAGQGPDEILAYGQRVRVVEATPLYTQIESPWGESGYVSTFDLVPIGR